MTKNNLMTKISTKQKAMKKDKNIQYQLIPKNKKSSDDDKNLHKEKTFKVAIFYLLLYLIDHNVKLFCQNFKSYCQNQIKTTDTVNLTYLTFVQDNT